MRKLSIRLEEDTYQHLSDMADADNTSVSDMIRKAVSALVGQEAHEGEDTNQQQSGQENSAERTLVAQLTEKDAQIAHMQERLQAADVALERQQQITMALTQQLDRTRLALEDSTRRRSVWQKVKAVFVAEGT